MVDELHYYKTAERPDIRLWLLDDAGALVNFATGYTFELKLGIPGDAAVFTKTTGIAGAAGAGVEPSGTPNVVITFTAGELDNIPARTYTWQIRATNATLDRIYQGIAVIHDVIG